MQCKRKFAVLCEAELTRRHPRCSATLRFVDSTSTRHPRPKSINTRASHLTQDTQSPLILDEAGS